jgi:hypothetical protein
MEGRRTGAWIGVGLLLGCGGVLTTSTGVVKRGVEESLASTYGEPFVVDRVNNNSNEGVGIVDTFSFTAHPASDLSLSFTGKANYENDPPSFSDRYRCLRIEKPLQAILARETDLPIHLAHSKFWCDNAALPVNPTLEGSLTGMQWRVRLHVFSDGPVADAAEMGRKLAADRAREAGITEYEADVFLFPAALLPSAAQHSASKMAHDEHLRAVVRQDEEPFIVGRFPTVEAEVAALAREVVGDALPLATHVTARGVAASRAAKQTPDAALAELDAEAVRQLHVVVRVAVESDEAARGLLKLTEHLKANLKPRWSLYVSVFQPGVGPRWAHPERYRHGWVWHKTSMGNGYKTLEYLSGPPEPAP